MPLLYSLDELKKTTENFVEELKKASIGAKNSLAFYKNKVFASFAYKSPLPASKVKLDSEFQVISMGGTVYVTAHAKKIDSTLLFHSQVLGNPPLFKNKDTFLSFFNKCLLSNINTIALNLAFPLKPVLRDGRLDGILVKGTKEHTFYGLIGENIGEELEQYIKRRYQKTIQVSVANDVVCLVLSGLSKAPWQNVVSGIVGTGTNFGFFLNEHTVVNLESGNFNNFLQSATGKKIDKTSARPGEQLFEKEVSGAYLFNHYNLFAKKHNFPPILSTKELDRIAASGSKEKSHIAQMLLERSASLVACQIAGIYFFKGLKQLTFIMEGSLFWKGWQYKTWVVEYIEKLGVPHKEIKFIKIKNSRLLGAARLVS